MKKVKSNTTVSVSKKIKPEAVTPEAVTPEAVTPEAVTPKVSDVVTFKVTNDITSARCLTLRGYLNASLSMLKQRLKDPVEGISDTGEITYQWVIKLNCNSIATIYSHKNGNPTKEGYKWFINATGSDVVKKVEDVLKCPTIEYGNNL